ncbi:MAG: hypothetical protein ABFC12_06980 [Methanobacterium sp.]
MINPTNVRGATFLTGRSMSIILVITMVTSATTERPLSQPKNLAIRTAKTIKKKDFTAVAHNGLPVGLISTFNLSNLLFLCGMTTSNPPV